MGHSKYRAYNTYQFLAQNTGIIIIRYSRGDEESKDLISDLMSLTSLNDNVKKIHVYIDLCANRYNGSIRDFLYNIFYDCNTVIEALAQRDKKLKIIIHYYKYQLLENKEYNTYELAIKNLRKLFPNKNLIAENKPACEHSLTNGDRDVITMVYLPNKSSKVGLYNLHCSIEDMVYHLDKYGKRDLNEFKPSYFKYTCARLKEDGGIVVD